MKTFFYVLLAIGLGALVFVIWYVAFGEDDFGYEEVDREH